MRCPRCESEYAGRTATCPNCQFPLLSTRAETISEMKGVAENGRRSRFLSNLRVAIMVVALIGLATVAMLNYVSGRQQQGKAAPKPASVPATPVAATPSPLPSAAPEIPASDQEVAARDESLPVRLKLKEERRKADKPDPEKPAASESASVSLKVEKNETPVLSAAIKPEPVVESKTVKLKASAPTGAAAAPAPEAESSPEISLEPPDRSLGQNIGLVTLNSYTRARIYIDGQYSGMTPRTVRLLAGEHTITMIADGYEEWTKTIRLNGRQQMGLMASLNKKGEQPR